MLFSIEKIDLKQGNFILSNTVICSKNEEDHEAQINRVLSALTSVKLTIQEKKCIFFAVKIPVLGYWLEGGGLRPNMSKLCNMLEWERPTTHTKLLRYIGIINFFRRFIPDLETILRPIRAITARTFDWYLQPDAETAYQQIYKRLVLDGPFLHFPKQGIQLELATDASTHAMGAVLFQTIGGTIHFLGFNSRKFNKAELGYSVPKKELIAVLFHCRYFRNWLWQRDFKLYTDSKALATILDKKHKKNTVLTGWLGELAEYSFEVYHIDGKKNVLPDLASRVRTVSVVDEARDETIELLRKVHQIGHWGATAMYKHITITLGRDIPNLMIHCRNFVRQCQSCLKVSDFRVAFAPPREPERYLPMQYVHFDLLEMPDLTVKGHRFILVMIDQFSGFVVLRPVTNKSAQIVGKKMYKIFLEWGFPESVKSDNGKEFCNEITKKVLEMAKVKKFVTIAHDHHANGLVERANRTIRSVMNRFLRDGDENKRRNHWHELVYDVQHAMNHRVHRITQSTPFSLMFGRNSFLSYGRGISDVSEQEARELQTQFWKIFNREVPKAVQLLQGKARTTYRHHTGTFNIGEWVVVKSHNKGKGEDKYNEEIYQIMGVDENGHYRVQYNGLERVEPANHLKRAAAPETTFNTGASKAIEEAHEKPGVEDGERMRKRRNRTRIDYAALNGGVRGVDDKRDRNWEET